MALFNSRCLHALCVSFMSHDVALPLHRSRRPPTLEHPVITPTVRLAQCPRLAAGSRVRSRVECSGASTPPRASRCRDIGNRRLTDGLHHTNRAPYLSLVNIHVNEMGKLAPVFFILFSVSIPSPCICTNRSRFVRTKTLSTTGSLKLYRAVFCFLGRAVREVNKRHLLAGKILGEQHQTRELTS